MPKSTRALVPDEMLHALRSTGLAVREMQGWREQSAGPHGEWGPVHGLVLHHSGSAAVERSLEEVRRANRPRAHLLVDRIGSVWTVASGRAHHAGQGSAEVLQAVTSARRSGLPVANTMDGDRFFYGVTAVHSGDVRDPWPEKQVAALVSVAVSLCREHRWLGGVPPVLGQWEWRRGGRGPTGLDMTQLRNAVAADLQRWRKTVVRVRGDSVGR